MSEEIDKKELVKIYDRTVEAITYVREVKILEAWLKRNYHLHQIIHKCTDGHDDHDWELGQWSGFDCKRCGFHKGYQIGFPTPPDWAMPEEMDGTEMPSCVRE